MKHFTNTPVSQPKCILFYRNAYSKEAKVRKAGAKKIKNKTKTSIVFSPQKVFCVQNE